MKSIKRILTAVMALTLILGAFSFALAEDYPQNNKTVTLYSHSGVGSNDLYIRGLQPYLQEAMGCPIVIENVVGAAGRLLSNQMWHADPDGYSLYSMTIPLIAAGDVFYADTNDYSVTGFEPILSFDATPYAVIVKKDSPYTTFEELMAAAMDTGIINGTSGVAGSMHLQSVVMQNATGAQIVDIPFDGSSGAMMAVMTGDCDMAILPADVPLKNQEEVTVLAVLSDERLPYYPDVPATSELGYDFTYLTSRRMVVAPPGTPQEILDIVQEKLLEAIESEGFQQWIADGGYVLEIHTGEEVRQLIQETYDAILELKDKIDLG